MTNGASTSKVQIQQRIALDHDTPTYSGSEEEDLIYWCRLISVELAGHTDWSGPEQVHAVTRKFRDAAQVWYVDYWEHASGDEEITSWQELKAALIERFKPLEKINTILDRLGSMKQGRRTVVEYARDMQKELAKVASEKIPLSISANWFLKGLNSREAAIHVSWRGYKTLDELIANTIEYVNTTRQHGPQLSYGQHYPQYQQQHPPQQPRNQQPRRPYTGPQPMELDALAFRPAPGNCFKCGQPGHRRFECVNAAICYACGKTGHGSRECTANGNAPRYASSRPSYPNRNRPAPRLNHTEVLEFLANMIAESQNRGNTEKTEDFVSDQ